MFPPVDEDRYWVGPAATPDTYQLISPLGGGGEGEVWKGVVPLSESGRGLVAIKILPPSHGEDDQASWNLYSHLLKSLDHPGLVRVIDVFLGPGKHRAGTVEATEVDTTELPSVPGMYRYVVMKLVEGFTLREWLDENAQAPISHRLRALSMVASALDEMHSGRQTGVPVAHGDVKPSNIIMREDGSSVLVDLGLTRIADGQGRVGRSRPYAAPELFAAGAVTTPEADRFAFYATLVHAVTGESPAMSEGRGPDIDSIAKLLRNHPLTARRPLLINGVLAALQSAPEGRPEPLTTWLASLTDTLSQTTQVVDAPGQQSTESVRKGRVARRVLVTTATVLAVAAAGFVYSQMRGASGNDTDKTLAENTQPPIVVSSPTTPATLAPSPTSTPHSSPAAQPTLVPSPSGTAWPGIEPGADYLSDRDKFQPTDGGYNTGATKVNGNFYTENLKFYVTYKGAASSATFVLGRHYSRLKAVVGIDDEAQANLRVRFTIVADNNTIFQKDLGKGADAAVDLSVTGVYSITISITNLTDDNGNGIFADARVLP